MLTRRNFALLYWTLTATLLVMAAVSSGRSAPIDPSLGTAQRIFYVHLPVALVTMLACGVVFVASIGYVWQRKSWWDVLAGAAGEVAVLYCSVLLLTGVIWARDAWGQWWTWSPRLTFSLMLWVLFVAYITVRRSIRDPLLRGMVCAVYGIIAFLDVPLMYLSVKLLPDIHPADVRLTPTMRSTLLLCLLCATLVCIGLICARYRSGMPTRVPVGPGSLKRRSPDAVTGVARPSIEPRARLAPPSPSPTPTVARGLGRARAEPRP